VIEGRRMSDLVNVFYMRRLPCIVVVRLSIALNLSVHYVGLCVFHI